MTASARHSSTLTKTIGSGMPVTRQAWRRFASTVTRLVVLAAAVGAIVMAVASPPVESVASVDIQRYAGTWYEVARIPNRFQAQCEGDVTATYRPLPDGSLDIINRCRRGASNWDVAVGRAVPAKGDDSGARLKVSFLPSWLRWIPGTQADYWVVVLDTDYSYSVVSDPERKYLWILSRTPGLERAVLESVVSGLRAQGYPVDALVPTGHASNGAAPTSARRTQLII